MKTIMVVFGTRPEAIKMCPLVKELEAHRDAFRTVVVVTGQHREMLDSVLKVFGVQQDFDLAVMKPGQTLADITTDVIRGMDSVLERVEPDAVLVHGDTTTSFAAALACFYRGIPVGHVEAGLRTYDPFSPFPEEFNRQAVDIFARWYFAPTAVARQNLLKEGKDPAHVFVTGNTGIDALRFTVSGRHTHPLLEWARGSRLVLLTSHRRENVGKPMHEMFAAVRAVVQSHPDVKMVYPVHPNPKVREIAQSELDGVERIRLVEPLDVLEFHNLINASYLVLTDSGGIQEEAPALGKPVLVMRDCTERPEGVEAGTLALVGTKRAGIEVSFSKLLDDPTAYYRMARASNPYGDGFASRRIVDVLGRKESW